MKSIIITIFGSYLCIIVLVYIFQRNLMYSPGQEVLTPQDTDVPEMSVINLTTQDGLAINSWYAPPQTDQKPVVLIYHGNAGTIAGRDFKARYFLDAGYGVLLVGYRGYANNPGSPSETGLYDDARTAFKHLINQDFAPERIVLYGESLGCAIAIQMAYEVHQGLMTGTPDQVAGIILEAPFTTMGDTAASHYPWLPANLLVKDKFNSIDKIPSLKSPLMIVHGSKDRTIAQSHGKLLFDKASSQKEALWPDQAGHNDLFDFGIGPKIINWMAKIL